MWSQNLCDYFVSVKCSTALILLNGGELCTAPHLPEVSQMSLVVVSCKWGREHQGKSQVKLFLEQMANVEKLSGSLKQTPALG